MIAGATFTPTVESAALDDAVLRIREHAEAIERMSRTEVAPKEFFNAFLERVTQSLAADGGSIWLMGRDGTLQAAYQYLDPAAAGLSAARPNGYQQYLKGVIEAGQGRIVVTNEPTQVGSAPCETYVLAPLASPRRTEGVVEIVQTRLASLAARRGHLQFLTQMSQLAGQYLAGHAARDLQRQRDLLAQGEALCRSLHASLDLTETAFAIVNESRRYLGCDRVSLTVRRGDRWRVEAISGQESFDVRSNVVQALERLGESVAASGQPAIYRSNDAGTTPSPEISALLGADPAATRLIAAVPLDGNRKKTAASAKPAAGALIVQHFAHQPLAGMSEQRLDFLRTHASLALERSIEHQGIFLKPWVDAIGKLRPVMRFRNWSSRARRTAYAAGGVLALALIPADFTVSGRGTLEPAGRRGVFAEVDGVVEDIKVQHGQAVAAGQELAQLRNTDLEVALASLRGELSAGEEQLAAIDTALLRGESRNSQERIQIASEREQIAQRLKGLAAQIALKEGQKSKLVLRSPIAGTVTTWDVRELLSDRPIARGQRVMSVADLAGSWELSLRVHESTAGHLAMAQRQSEQPLKVRFSLATDPATRYEGAVIEVADRADTDAHEGNSVLVRVRVDQPLRQDAHPGATVTSRIECGSRSLGYVWFHDVLEFIQSRILFRV